MAAKDKYHEHVKEALIKDGWTITHDPYVIKFDGEKDKYEIQNHTLFVLCFFD